MPHANGMVRMIQAGLLALSCASCGPHMRIQQSIKPYEQQMPNMPAGSVPRQGSLQELTQQQSRQATNPLPQTPANLQLGTVYYNYYCVQCHGKDGSGNGPVGQSYVPKPTDLSSPTVTSMNDGALYLAMLHGVGHDPIMSQTVLLQHRWPLVMYVRSFSRKGQPPQGR